MDIMETIREQLEGNRIILYMKGSPNQPQCGFSARTVQALMSCGERFAYVDVLSSPEIRANMPTYANWPTFPQLWVCLLYTSPSPRDRQKSRMPSSA